MSFKYEDERDWFVKAVAILAAVMLGIFLYFAIWT